MTIKGDDSPYQHLLTMAFSPVIFPIFRPSSMRFGAPVDEAAIAASPQRGPLQGVGVAAGDGAEEGIDLAECG